MVKPLLLSPAVLLLALLPASAQQRTTHKPAAKDAQAGESAQPATVNVLPPRPAIKQIYKFDCAVCHGENGNGKSDLATSMNLTLDDWTTPATLSAKSDQELYEVIRKGKNQMPPEDAARAKDEEIRELVKYIRSFAAHAPAEPVPAAEPAPAAPASPAEKPTTPRR